MGGDTRKNTERYESDLYIQETPPSFDPRFPIQNKSFNCFVNYVDYLRCLDILNGENKKKCETYRKFVTSLCPEIWVDRWDDMKNKGLLPQPILSDPTSKHETKKGHQCKIKHT